MEYMYQNIGVRKVRTQPLLNKAHRFCCLSWGCTSGVLGLRWLWRYFFQILHTIKRKSQKT